MPPIDGRRSRFRRPRRLDAVSEPRDELRELGAALAGHARRLRARGVRVARRPSVRSASTPKEIAPAVRPSSTAAVSSPSSTGAPIPPPSKTADLFAAQQPPAFKISSPAAIARKPGSPEAEANRARAAACADLESLRAAVAACTACELCKTRTQTVFADGTPRARVMFVGEGPGENEDLQGLPFVGRAGQLLTDIIEKGMGLKRSDVYIANVVKCRPPNNRDPSDAEKQMCTPWLDRQIELLAPEVIVTLGRHASNHVLGLEGPRALSMGALRGRVHERNGRKVVPTFHPAYLLRSPSEKKECWKDIQLAMGLLGLEPPPGRRSA